MSSMSGGAPPTRDHQVADIMTDTAIRYRRNVVMVCVIIIALYKIKSIDFGSLSLFGLTLENASDANNEKLVWYILSILFTYQCGAFLAYTLVAYRIWRRSVMLPDIQWWGYAFNLTPKKSAPHIKHLFTDLNARAIEVSKTQDLMTVVLRSADGTSRDVANYQSNRLFVYRMKLIMFWTIEFGIPYFLLCLSLGLLIEKVGNLFW